jgi:omega-6 fatty acid desaturase (delta-12 desaturase)
MSIGVTPMLLTMLTMANYTLEACAKENSVLNKFVNVLTFHESLKCINNKLWDEEKQRMVSFKAYKKMLR